MQIVVLDGYTLNPGDLSWAALEALGPCTVYDRTPPEETVARAAEAEIVLTNKTVLSREIIERLPRLRYIGVLATGYNIVDVEAARERNIPVMQRARLRHAVGRADGLRPPAEPHAARGRPRPRRGRRPLEPKHRLLLLGLSAGGIGRADDGRGRLRADRPGHGAKSPWRWA